MKRNKKKILPCICGYKYGPEEYCATPNIEIAEIACPNCGREYFGKTLKEARAVWKIIMEYLATTKERKDS